MLFPPDLPLSLFVLFPPDLPLSLLELFPPDLPLSLLMLFPPDLPFPDGACKVVTVEVVDAIAPLPHLAPKALLSNSSILSELF
jgi:hypothetical protein